MKDKVLKITDDGFYKERPKWKVVLEKGGEYTFFTKFEAKVGDTIEYEVSNAKYKTAKLISAKEYFGSTSNLDIKDYRISRAVAFKGAIDLATSGKIPATDESISEYTERLLKIVLIK
tara:strand:- start:1759 stop:2112 length:354 start_codon:yes stop_codon:yes gene_type:complete